MQQGRRELRRDTREKLVREGASPEAVRMVLRAQEEALASLDQKMARDLEQAAEDRYALLGVVDVTVRLPETQAQRADLYVYLVPERVGADEWAKERLIYCVDAGFARPPVSSDPLPAAVPVRFEG